MVHTYKVWNSTGSVALTTQSFIAAADRADYLRRNLAGGEIYVDGEPLAGEDLLERRICERWDGHGRPPEPTEEELREAGNRL